MIKSFGILDDYFCIELGRKSIYGKGFITLKSTRPDAIRVHRHLQELVRKAFEKLKYDLDQDRDEERRQQLNYTSLAINGNSQQRETTNSANVNMRYEEDVRQKNSPQNIPQYPYPTKNESEIEIRRIDGETSNSRDSYYNNNYNPNTTRTPTTNDYTRSQQEMSVYRAVMVNNSPYNDDNSYSTRNNQQNNGLGRIGMTNGMGYNNEGFYFEEIEYESETDESFYEEKYVPQYVSNRNLPSVALEYFHDNGNSIYGKVKL